MNSLSINRLLHLLEDAAWYAFLLMLPLQTRYIFGFQSWGFLEWNAISLYLTDIIFAFLLAFWAWHARWKRGSAGVVDALAALLVAAAALSIGNSTHQATSLYQWAKLVEGVTLFCYVRWYALGRFPLPYSLGAFLAGSVLQSAIAIGQYLKQHDLGLWFLGESILSPYLKGIASFYISEKEKVIRAYGTTPHPNILATYLAIAMLGYWYYAIRIIKRERTLLVSLLGYAVMFFAFLMTFSRTVIFGWAVVSSAAWLVMFFRSVSDRRRLAIIAMATLAMAGLFAGLYQDEIVARFTISADDEALTLRLYYGRQAFRTGEGGLNWSGVGIGNFVNWFMEAVPTLPRYLYQPVHNVYLLAYSETGILGIGAFLALLVSILWHFIRSRRADRFLWLTAGASIALLVFIGIFDHFPWTLQQGRLLFWLVLGCAAGLVNDAKS